MNLLYCYYGYCKNKQYYNNHKDNLKNIDNAYTVGFLEQPNFQNLDYREYFWIVKLK